MIVKAGYSFENGSSNQPATAELRVGEVTALLWMKGRRALRGQTNLSNVELGEASELNRRARQPPGRVVRGGPPGSISIPGGLERFTRDGSGSVSSALG